MAHKSADYVAIAVRYDAAQTRIQAVQIRINNGQHHGLTRTIVRPDVIALLEGGYTFCTARRNGRGAWQRGAELMVVVIDGERFIRSGGDAAAADEVDEVPTF